MQEQNIQESTKGRKRVCVSGGEDAISLGGQVKVQRLQHRDHAKVHSLDLHLHTSSAKEGGKQSIVRICVVVSALLAIVWHAFTYWALVNTTAIESELQRRRLGAITSARFAGVILVTVCVRSSRKSCKKLITNKTTRRLIVGSRVTMRTQASGS